VSADLYMRKAGQLLIPSDELSREWIEDRKDGRYKVKITKDRDPIKFRKWWAMVNFAYKNWDVDESDGIMKMSLENFRKELIKMAGFCRQVWRLDGTFTVEAESISFSKMKDQEFNILYSKTVDVILQKVLTGYTKDDLENVVLELLRFA
jgi:hypothetical protein